MHTIRRLHAVFALAVLGCYLFLPFGVRDVVYLLTATSTVLALIIGTIHYRPGVRTPWVLLGAGFAVYVVADSFYVVQESLNGTDVPFPSPADALYLLFYVLLFLALAALLRTGGYRDRAAWLDASMWTLGVAVLAWEPLIQPYLADAQSTTLVTAMALAYPGLDLLVLLMAMRVVVGRTTRNTAGLVLAGGLLVQTVGDIVYGIQALNGTYVSGGPLDLAWLVTYVAVGGVALHPSMVSLTERDVAPVGLTSRVRLIFLLAPASIVPAVLAHYLLSGQLGGRERGAAITVGAMALMLVLAGARGLGLLDVAQRHADALTTRQRALEAALEDRERVAAELQHRVNRDTLTGLASRDLFVESLGAALAACRDGASHPSIAFLDLDDFKSVNDTLGHDAGDRLLVEVASRLQGCVRPEDLVARFGGDEFAVLTLGNGELVAERLLEVLRTPMVLHGRELRLEVSVGVTTATGRTSSSAGDMLREADVAMYNAKRAGGGWARYRAGMSAELLQRLDLRAELVQALHNNEIQPWFQPVVDLRTGTLLGFEALARWCRPGHRPAPPSQWLPLAEETGLIVTVDRAILIAAVSQLELWRRTYPVGHLHLAVNMSGRTLQQAGLEQEVLATLQAAGLPPRLLTVEVTEGVLIDDEEVGPRLQRLRAAGVRIALDDFGTGWSSLSNLRRLPVDQLKLDRSFTEELCNGPGGEAVPAAVIQLARALSLDVVAEGVETPAQRARLLQLGYEASQGTLFGPAEAARDLEDRVLESGLLDQASLAPRRYTEGGPLTVVR